jgi:hypothetical protein
VVSVVLALIPFFMAIQLSIIQVIFLITIAEVSSIFTFSFSPIFYFL